MTKIVNAVATASKCWVSASKASTKFTCKSTLRLNSIKSSTVQSRYLTTVVAQQDHYNAKDFELLNYNQQANADNPPFSPTISVANDTEVHTPGHSKN